MEIILMQVYLLTLMLKRRNVIPSNVVNLIKRSVADAGEIASVPSNIIIINRNFLVDEAGGVNYLCAIWAGGFAARGHRVTILCEGNPRKKLRYKPHKNIEIMQLRPKIPFHPFTSLPAFYGSWNLAVQKLILEYSKNYNCNFNILSTIAGLEGYMKDVSPTVNCICYLVTDHKIHKSYQESKTSNERRLTKLVDVERKLLNSNNVQIAADSNAIVRDLALELSIPDLTERTLLVPIGWPRNNIESQPEITFESFFLYIGAISFRKGIKTLLESWKLIFDQPDMRNTHLLVCGIASDDTESLTFLREKSTLFRVRYLPRITEEEKLFLIRRAMAIIVPSNYESFGIVALEGLQEGKIVIGANCGGLEELIANPEMMFSPGDAQSLSQLIISVQNRKLVTDPLMAQAQAHKFELSKMLKMLEQLFI